MNLQLNNYLAKAVVDMAIFLEFSDEQLIDQDAAVAALEGLAENLQRLEQQDRVALCAQFRVLS